MLRDLKRAILIALTALAGSHASAMAGGLYLNEFATPSMGTAGAGQEAYANDASTNFALHNPAGMTRLDGNQVSLGAGLVVGDTKFDPDASTPFGGGDGGNQAGLAPLLGSHGVYSITDDLKLGMSVFSISGAALDPSNSWSGRYQLQKIELLTVTANPNVAYRVNNVLSLGAGVMAMYADLDYRLAAPPGGVGRVRVDGNDWAYGYNAGALIELGPGTRFGVTYVSKVEPDFSGDLSVDTGGGPAFSTGSNLKLTFPQLVLHRLEPETDLSPARAGWRLSRAQRPMGPPRHRRLGGLERIRRVAGLDLGRHRQRADRVARHLSLQRRRPLSPGAGLAAAGRHHLRHLAGLRRQ
jgi:long-subunit fatty acid transport protein